MDLEGKVETEVKKEYMMKQMEILYENFSLVKYLGFKYFKKFVEVYDADVLVRDQKMKEVYEQSQTDESLDEPHKALIKRCYTAYKAAVGDGSKYSLPLVIFIDKKKPNLAKFINSGVRIKRLFEDLKTVIYRSGFKFDIEELWGDIRRYMVLFSFKNKNDLNSEYCYEENLMFAAISRFARSIPKDAVDHLWYLLMFMKNLNSYKSMTAEIYNANEFLKPQVASILNTFNAILQLEEKRINKDTTPVESEDSSTS